MHVFFADEERAVSDVLGAVLLVGITVVMAAAFGVLLLSYDGPNDTQHTQLAITIGPGSDQDWGPNDAELRIKHIGGEPLRQGDVTIQYTEAGGSAQVVQPTFTGGSLRIGQSWTRTISAFPGDSVSVLVVVDLGSTAQVLASTLVPAGGAATVTLTYADAFVATQGTVGSFANLQDDDDADAAALLSEASVGAPSTTVTFNGASSGDNGAVSPANVLTSNDQRAVLDNGGDYVHANNFNIGSPFAITQVVMGFEGRGTAGVTTVALAQQVSGTAGAGSTVVSGSVTAAATQVYVAIVGHGDDTNPTVAVSSVAGLGLTWTRHQEVISGSSNSGRGQMEMWVGSGTATSSGAVTATFAQSIEDAIIWVTGWTGADAASPIQASNTAFSSGTSGTWSVPSIAGTSGGRMAAFVNIVSASDATFLTSLPLLAEPSAEIDKDDVHLAFAHGAASAGNVASGTLNSAQRWQAIAFTIRPGTIAFPAVQLTYHLSGGAAGASTLAPTLTGSDAAYTRDITADRAWTAADFANLAVRVTITGPVAGSTAEIDHAYVTVTTTSGPATHSMDIQLTWPVPGQLPPGGTHYLQLRYLTAVDTFTVEALTAPATWRACTGTLASATYTTFACQLLASEVTGNTLTIRFRDVTPSGTQQGSLSLDYARVAST